MGIKPIGKVQWNFKAYYLYEAVAPQTGESLWLEFSHLDGVCFHIFLEQLAAEYPKYLNIVQLQYFGQFLNREAIPTASFTNATQHRSKKSEWNLNQNKTEKRPSFRLS